MNNSCFCTWCVFIGTGHCEVYVVVASFIGRKGQSSGEEEEVEEGGL